MSNLANGCEGRAKLTDGAPIVEETQNAFVCVARMAGAIFASEEKSARRLAVGAIVIDGIETGLFIIVLADACVRKRIPKPFEELLRARHHALVRGCDASGGRIIVTRERIARVCALVVLHVVAASSVPNVIYARVAEGVSCGVGDCASAALVEPAASGRAADGGVGDRRDDTVCVKRVL